MSALITDGQYTLTPSKDLVQVTDPVLEEAQRRLTVHRGSCFWDLSFGSLLHTLSRSTLSDGWERGVEDVVLDALQPMVDRGELADLTVVVARTQRNRVDLVVTAVKRTREVLTFSHWIAV